MQNYASPFVTISMNIESAYDLWSSTYDLDRNLTRDLDREVTKKAFTGRRFDNILELGCGTGKNTVLLSDIANCVHALDFSESMIQQARQKLSVNNVEFTQVDLTRLWPTKSNSHDLVICNLVLEHIDDLSHIFREACRSLQMHGSLYISELHPCRQYRGGKARFERDGEVTEIQAFIHHVSDFFQAAAANNLDLVRFSEYWHSEDDGKPPRLSVFEFKKA